MVERIRQRAAKPVWAFDALVRYQQGAVKILWIALGGGGEGRMGGITRAAKYTLLVRSKLGMQAEAHA